MCEPRTITAVCSAARISFHVTAVSALLKLVGMAAIRRGGAGLLSAAALALFCAGVEIRTAATAMADPPYQSCSDARADGRSSIPYTDPAYRPDLDFDGDGLACEPGKGRRSTR